MSALDAPRPNDGLSVRRNGRQMLFGNCTFNIEGIPICDGGTLICVAKVALDHAEVAIHQDDGSSSGVPNTKQRLREHSWHRVSGATCKL